MPTNETPVNFRIALSALSDALRQIGKAAEILPELPAGGHMHGNVAADLRVVTVGLEQSCYFDQDTCSASTNGWQDMGDMSGPEFLWCDCGATFRVPSDMDWN